MIEGDRPPSSIAIAASQSGRIIRNGPICQTVAPAAASDACSRESASAAPSSEHIIVMMFRKEAFLVQVRFLLIRR
jgi:hypothetical protein